MATQAALKDKYGLDAPAHIESAADVPVLLGRQRQGDVYFIPQRRGLGAGQAVPTEGVALVRGEAMGNTHLLLPSGGVTYRTLPSSGYDVGVIDVADGATAYIHHIEHGYMGFGPGSYLVRGQREQADEIRRVAD